jgi:hypothetical protein
VTERASIWERGFYILGLASYGLGFLAMHLIDRAYFMPSFLAGSVLNLISLILRNRRLGF